MWLPSFPDSLSLAALATAVVLTLWRKRRASALVLLAGVCGLCPLAGCSTAPNPDVRLSAAFDRPRIIYDPDQTKIPLRLIVRNEGNVSVKVYKVDGGCGCRKIDQSGFPAVLAPGTMTQIAAQLATPPKAELENFMIQFETDHGVVGAPASLVILARDSFSPEAVGSATLDEEDGWDFEVVHRAVFESDGTHKNRLALEVPPQFVASEIDVHGGPVAIAPQFTYQDTKYRITLKDRSIGLHKAFGGVLVVLNGREADPFGE